ncbi:type VII secretion protein EccE [Mycobacterium deserti]|uniref:Type VII secretion protein EccE n=1 Tax=Mycobacterium deserti TaxID=2978347 RepID=A0ABT2MCA4_9MYCO|nr:type VII secretion protein EccE [Mycobacterium deserti]MCT7658770.1 type VII secretion protein EccE [Mycobacterium deserti]
MTVRLALALLMIVAAATAFPWNTDTDWWILGVAGAVLVMVLAWWRGQFVTTMIVRQLKVWRRNRSRPKQRPSHRVSVLLRVEDPDGVGLSLPLVAGYVERFGLRCETVSVTSRDLAGSRATWIRLTLDAAANLAALQARSPEMPLRDTAETTGRRLADHLRETGLTVAFVEVADAPVAGAAREMWRGVRDERGVVSAYAMPVDDRIIERLAELRLQPMERWTVLEFSGAATKPTVAAACALRTTEPVRAAPVRGLIAKPGLQGPLLAAMDPTSNAPLGISSSPLPQGLLERIVWPVGSGELSRT